MFIKFLFICCTFCCLWAGTSTAKIHLGILGGGLLQPSSQYYHFSRGIYSGISHLEKYWLLFSYIKRPTFKAVGFIDGEELFLGQLGLRLPTPWGRLLGFLGAGQVNGFIGNSISSEYFQLKGLSTQVQYGFSWKSANISFVFINFQGMDSEQVRAFVMWPYNFVGMSLELKT